METKKWYYSRTLWVAIITAVIGVLTVLGQEIPDAGWIVTTIGILNFALRLNTTQTIK
jgi:hypothetical protein